VKTLRHLWETGPLFLALILNISFQFTVATRSGLFGLVAVDLVVEERNIVIVSAQILGQHTEDEGVSVLDHGKNHGLVTFSSAQVQAQAKTCS